MSEEPKKIAIIGYGKSAIMMKIMLETKHPDWNVGIICMEDHLSEREIKMHREEEDKRLVVLDELVDQSAIAKAIVSLRSPKPNFDMSVEADQREMYAERRYQKPARIRGAAQQKRQARKAKNRGKR